jgi:hypothetical protein
LRQLCAAPAAPEKEGSQLMFQCLDAGAYRGLGHIQPLRGANKVSGSGDSKKGTGKFNIHGQFFISN